jgi:hypothetical protein
LRAKRNTFGGANAAEIEASVTDEAGPQPVPLGSGSRFDTRRTLLIVLFAIAWPWIFGLSQFLALPHDTPWLVDRAFIPVLTALVAFGAVLLVMRLGAPTSVWLVVPAWTVVLLVLSVASALAQHRAPDTVFLLSSLPELLAPPLGAWAASVLMKWRSRHSGGLAGGGRTEQALPAVNTPPVR